MSDHMMLRGIRVYGHGGVNPGEQEVPQAFDVDVELEVDLERSSHSDMLEDTLDYRAIHRTVIEAVGESRFALIERLAQEIARRIMHEPRVLAVSVSVAKPGILSGATPSVTLRRRR